jgi:hypothetical protein
MADDKTLSETLIDKAVALQKWEAVAPIAAEVASVVKEYREVIDGVSSAFGIVRVVWNIFSSIEEAKEDAAKQKAMVDQITKAGTSLPSICLLDIDPWLTPGTVDIMMRRATSEIINHIDKKELDDAIDAVQSVQRGFRHDFLPYVKTLPLDIPDSVHIIGLIDRARAAIDKLHSLIERRAKEGDGGAVLVLYRHLQGGVQCKLAMDRWLHGLTPETVAQADYEMTRMIQVWVWVVRGLQGMSDRSFSQGLIEFHAGGGGDRPEIYRYSYHYQGMPAKRQPGASSSRAAVAQDFIAARKKARDEVIPAEVFEWNRQTYEIFKQVQELKTKVSA